MQWQWVDKGVTVPPRVDYTGVQAVEAAGIDME